MTIPNPLCAQLPATSFYCSGTGTPDGGVPADDGGLADCLPTLPDSRAITVTFEGKTLTFNTGALSFSENASDGHLSWEVASDDGVYKLSFSYYPSVVGGIACHGDYSFPTPNDAIYLHLLRKNASGTFATVADSDDSNSVGTLHLDGWVQSPPEISYQCPSCKIGAHQPDAGYAYPPATVNGTLHTR